MEFAVLILLALAAGLLHRVGRQRQDLKARDADLRKLDDKCRELGALADQFDHDDKMERARLAAMVDVAFDALLLLDDELALVACNEGAATLLGEADPRGKPLADLIDCPELLSLLQVARQESEALEEQFLIDGANYRARTHHIDHGGAGRYICLALQDISELVSLNRARRDLVANISHELRTPITRIRLIIEGLFLDANKPKRKASIQSLKEIAMETDSLLWLAQELLDLSMIESGEKILRLVPRPLQPLVDEASERLAAQAELKNLRLVSRTPANIAVLCDADQLKRVLANLLHNAVKWSPSGEAITVSAREDRDEVIVSIVDNGPGVPEDLLERVFERFYQADLSRSSHDGAGLGLAICKHIVEAHGGRIWAEGKRDGRGGRFSFTVLKADAAPSAEAHSIAPAETAVPLA